MTEIKPNKLRGKAFADFLHSMNYIELSEYMDAHPGEVTATEKAMTPEEANEYWEAVRKNIPQELLDADEEDDDDDYEESYLPEDTGNSFFDSLNKRLNEHDREYWERRKKGIPFEKTI